MGLQAHFVYPLVIYLIWQILYLFITGKLWWRPRVVIQKYLLLTKLFICAL